MKEKERYSLEEFDDIDWELAIVDNELGKSLTFEEIKNLLNLQDKEIKKLCQQIIDLNKENNDLRKFKEDILRVQAEPYQLYEENQRLKQEVNDWKQRFDSSEKWNKTLLQNSATVNKLKTEKIDQLKQSQKQFAIEQLQKLKAKLINNISPVLLSYDDYVQQVHTKINNQIKELKGETKNDQTRN